MKAIRRSNKTYRVIEQGSSEEHATEVEHETNYSKCQGGLARLHGFVFRRRRRFVSEALVDIVLNDLEAEKKCSEMADRDEEPRRNEISTDSAHAFEIYLTSRSIDVWSLYE
jgi:hypothetical protein